MASFYERHRFKIAFALTGLAGVTAVYEWALQDYEQACIGFGLTLAAGWKTGDMYKQKTREQVLERTVRNIEMILATSRDDISYAPIKEQTRH